MKSTQRIFIYGEEKYGNFMAKKKDIRKNASIV